MLAWLLIEGVAMVCMSNKRPKNSIIRTSEAASAVRAGSVFLPVEASHGTSACLIASGQRNSPALPTPDPTPSGMHSSPSAVVQAHVFQPDLQLVLKVGYQGSAYAGFAEQENAPTVAGELRKALTALLGRDVELVCAGRTDAGVHALAQIVATPVLFSEREAFSAERILRGLQALVSNDISIRGVYAAPPSFSPRFDALSRTYKYRIAQGKLPLLSASFVTWEKHPLDIALMRRAARYFIGTHDFTSFCKATSARENNTERTIKKIKIRHEELLGDSLVSIQIEGHAFLHNMVRIMAGSLAMVGRGKRDSHWIKEVLNAADRRAAGPTYPPQGLILEGVRYKAGIFEPW